MATPSWRCLGFPHQPSATAGMPNNSSPAIRGAKSPWLSSGFAATAASVPSLRVSGHAATPRGTTPQPLFGRQTFEPFFGRQGRQEVTQGLVHLIFTTEVLHGKLLPTESKLDDLLGQVHHQVSIPTLMQGVIGSQLASRTAVDRLAVARLDSSYFGPSVFFSSARRKALPSGPSAPTPSRTSRIASRSNTYPFSPLLPGTKTYGRSK